VAAPGYVAGAGMPHVHVALCPLTNCEWRYKEENDILTSIGGPFF